MKVIRYFLVSVLALAGCSASRDSPGSHGSQSTLNSQSTPNTQSTPNSQSSRSRHRPATRSPSLAAVDEQVYLGHAVITGGGDLAACPLAWDLEQYRNDMRNMRVDPASPSYAVASAYDLHNRRCIELTKGERVDIMGDSSRTETLVRPLGQSQTYWTTANWTRPEALEEPGRSAKEPAHSRQ